jgi:hypothetical protein
MKLTKAEKAALRALIEAMKPVTVPFKDWLKSGGTTPTP